MYTALTLLAVAVFVIYQYLFPVKTIKQILYGSEQSLTEKQFWGFDVSVSQALIAGGFFGIGLPAWVFTEYVRQQNIWNGSTEVNYPVMSPQDVYNFTLWGICAFQVLVVGKFSMFLMASKKKVDETPSAKPDTTYSARGWLNFGTMLTSMSLYLFMGWYSWATFTSATIPTGCPDPNQCYLNNATYGPILIFNGLNGLLLALVIAWNHFRSENNNITGEAPALFVVDEDLSDHVMQGWVPYYFINIGIFVASFFYTATVSTMVYHDIIKGSVVTLLWCVLPTSYMLLSRQLGSFYAYQCAAIMLSIPVFYFSSVVLAPAKVGGSMSVDELAKFTQYGMMVSGPDSEANMAANVLTLQVGTYFTFSVLVSTILYMYGGKTTLNQMASNSTIKNAETAGMWFGGWVRRAAFPGGKEVQTKGFGGEEE
jgi:hypothetical protein